MGQRAHQKPDNAFAPQDGWDSTAIDLAVITLTVYSVERCVLVKTEHRVTHKTVRFYFTINTACCSFFSF